MNKVYQFKDQHGIPRYLLVTRHHEITGGDQDKRTRNRLWGKFSIESIEEGVRLLMEEGVFRLTPDVNYELKHHGRTVLVIKDGKTRAVGGCQWMSSFKS